MFRYLSAHPSVRRPLRKEIDYFSAHYGRPLSWYAAHFPLRRATQTFDCTPQYFVHPLAPERCHDVLPDARLVVMLRDPVARLMSQYSHMRRHGFESLTLAEALAAEATRISEDLDAIRRDPAWNPKQFFRFGYLARSRYGEQLDRWLQHYPRTSIHLLDFDEFVRSPDEEWTRLLDFLGLPMWVPPDFRNWSSPTPKPRTEEELLRQLRERLAPDTERLLAHSSRTFSWA